LSTKVIENENVKAINNQSIRILDSQGAKNVDLSYTILVGSPSTRVITSSQKAY
jgi:hypothetical protein